MVCGWGTTSRNARLASVEVDAANARALDALESSWAGRLEGSDNMAHIAVAVALEYLDFRHGDRNWRTGRDALAKWQAEFAKRDAMQATQPV